MINKKTFEKEIEHFEKLIEKSNLTIQQLYDLYTNTLLEDEEHLKKKLNGLKLELSLFIKYLSENNFPVDKIKNIIEKYFEKKQLIKLIQENKELFKEEDHIKTLIDFINNKKDIIFVSVPLDNTFFIEIKQHNKTYEILKDYIISAIEAKENKEIPFYKLEIK